MRIETMLITGKPRSVAVEISETGGTAVSPTPGGEYPGEASPRLAVRVTVDDPSPDPARGQALTARIEGDLVVDEVAGRASLRVLSGPVLGAAGGAGPTSSP